MKTAIALPIDQITKFCQHWQIIELSLFGSILRDDFHAESDIDRPVDLIIKRAIAVPTRFAVKKFSLRLKLFMSNSRHRASLIERSFYFNNCFSRFTRCAIAY